MTVADAVLRGFVCLGIIAALAWFWRWLGGGDA